MSAGMQDGVVEGVGVDKASDNHCSLFLPLKNRHGLPLSRYLRYLLTCPLPFLSIAKSMKYLYSSRRSDATSSLIHASPLMQTLITFNAETVKQILRLDYSRKTPVLFMLAHTAQFAILLSVIMWLRGSPGYLTSGPMRRFSTRLSVSRGSRCCQTLQSRSASANKEISFNCPSDPNHAPKSLPLPIRGIPMGQALHAGDA